MKVTYIDANETRHVIEAHEGQSLMEIAVENNIPGIIGECGGHCSCATCHVHVEPEYGAMLDAPSREESGLLEYVPHTSPRSRLACQIRINKTIDGITVSIPLA